jgi:GNAT superfamily N-acetyltransferase
VREHRRIAYLTNVYTRAEYRGRGIGRASSGARRRPSRAAADVESTYWEPEELEWARRWPSECIWRARKA